MNTHTTRSRRRASITVAAAVVATALFALATPASAATGERLGGADRFATAAAISEQFGCENVDEEVVIANGFDFPDGLTGSVLEERILLTDTDVLPPATIAELDRIAQVCNDIEEIYVLGGTAAVSEAVFDKLNTDYTPDVIERIGGANRYETAIEIAEFSGASDTVFLATGEEFPDSLAAGPVAGDQSWPILLNNGTALRADVAQYLTSPASAVNDVIILGGTAAIPQSVEDELGNLGFNVQRLSGSDRFETATTVADFFVGIVGPPLSGAVLVNGDDFPDVLAAGPFGAMNERPIVLANTDTPLPSSTETWLGANEPPVVVAIGGTAAISDAVLDAAVAAATP